MTLLSDPLLLQGQRGRSRPIAIIDGREVIEGEVLVRYRSEAGAAARRRAEFDVDSEEAEAIGRRGARRVRSRRLSTRAMLQALGANPDVDYAEPNYLIRLAHTPGDPSFGNLWGLFNSGQTIGGVPGIPGADIDAPGAWQFTTGSRAHVVGVIDTGIDYHHPDLAANMWTAPRPFSVVIGGLLINCAAGTHGYNAIINTCVPMDDHSHGTHVAGTIGAVGNNGVGVAGVSWQASMMALKFLDASGSGSTSDAIKTIEFAMQAKAAFGADANVRILSNSWGGGGYSLALANQIEAANTADMLFVAAAGNSGRNNDVYPHYPSSYPNSNVVSVMSTTNRDQRSTFSNFGISSVDLGAPGSQILSTVPNNGYAFFNGTSMATPQVSGAVALILSVCPMNTGALKSLLLASVDLPASLAGLSATAGRLDVNNAIRSCAADPPSLTVNTASVIPGGTIRVTLADGPRGITDWVGLYPAAATDTGYVEWTYLNGLRSAPGVGIASTELTFTAPAGSGTYEVRLFANNSYHKLAASTAITVSQPIGMSLGPAVTLRSAVVAPGGTIDLQVVNGPANAADWIGLFPVGAADNRYQHWVYLNGEKTAPSVGLRNASLQLAAPPAGAYNVRLFANNGFVRLATSSSFTVAAPRTLTIDDVTVTESNLTATFTVTLAPINPSQAVTVAFATADGTATIADNDYAAAAGTVTFAPNVATQTITVAVNADTKFEGNEAFTVNLSNAANAAIGDTQGVGTIVNDDVSPAPSVTVQTLSVNPGAPISFAVANGPRNATDWVGLFPAAAADTAYERWLYLNGLKTPPASGLADAKLEFPAPSTPGLYNVRLFANNGYTNLATSATIAVAAAPALSINDVTIVEGDNGIANATFTVTLSPVDSSQSVTVDYATANGTATDSNDYAAISGTLTFEPSVATQTITVPVIGDINVEDNETFFVNLSSRANAVLADAQGLATITSDDGPAGPSITIDSLTVALTTQSPPGRQR